MIVHLEELFMRRKFGEISSSVFKNVKQKMIMKKAAAYMSLEFGKVVHDVKRHQHKMGLKK